LKIALITDTHFGARNDNLNFNEYFFDFYENQFFPYLKENNIKTVIHLGDVMDRRKYISYRIAKDFRERFVHKLVEMNLDVHMLVGNHDIYFKNTNDINGVTELIGNDIPNITLYQEAKEVDFDGFPILMLPWINSENVTVSYKAIEETKASVCMSHLEISGFAMNKGIVNDGGFDRKDFRKFDTLFSGHFHVKSDDGQIFYLGTPYELYWNDCDDPKGFHIFDTETRELERIINPRNIHTKIYYDDGAKIGKYDKHNFTEYKNKYVKLIVVNKKDLYGFDKFVDNLLKADCHDVKIIEDFSDLDASNVSDDIVENTEDTMTLLNKYIDELTVDLDTNRLKTTMKSLYTEAQDLEI